MSPSRTHEIGVRIALGASGIGILRLVMGKEGAVMTGAGVAIGLLGAGRARSVCFNRCSSGVSGTDARSPAQRSLRRLRQLAVRRRIGVRRSGATCGIGESNGCVTQ